MRYAIVEDEPPARLRLEHLVKELRPDALCLGQSADGVGGLTLLQEVGSSLDVLFLDIEFPPGGAFGLLGEAQRLNLVLPRIVFVTAYQQFALEAFRWAACDYLLKPIERGRLATALSRLTPQPPALSILMQALRAEQQKQVPARFIVQHRGRQLVLSWDEISCVMTENRLLFAHTPQGRYLLERTLEELERRLQPRFFRTHRSAMVRLEAVREIVSTECGGGEVILEGGLHVPVARERMGLLRQAIEAGGM